ncbi:MAG: transposase [Planctomycetes bacterium]|nr:transposase [Planctomycetota bacterium]
MPRLPRAHADEPAAWHHVMNRGLARRTVFENVRDVRYFLSCLARMVRAGRLEVHAYCLLTTHFHLLVRSPTGELSRAIGEAVNKYVRWFNRSRRRDGPLFRGRFRSRSVDSVEYRRQLIRYIDHNPVLAGLATIPSVYPHSSARAYARLAGPPWLARDWVEHAVREAAGRARYEPRDYFASFGVPLTASLSRVVERRIERAARGPDPLDDLLGATPERVLCWMRRKAELADGTSVDWPVCDAEDIADAIAEARARQPGLTLRSGRKRLEAWPVLEVALLRELGGARWLEVAARLGGSDDAAADHYARHVQALASDADYAAEAARVAAAAIARCYGIRRERHRVDRDAGPRIGSLPPA